MFAEDVRSMLADSLPGCEEGRIVCNSIGEEYRVDAYVDGERPLLVFAIGSIGKCLRALVAVMALSEGGYTIVSVVDGDAGMPRSDVEKLENRCDLSVSGTEALAEAISVMMSMAGVSGYDPAPEGG